MNNVMVMEGGGGKEKKRKETSLFIHRCDFEPTALKLIMIVHDVGGG